MNINQGVFGLEEGYTAVAHTEAVVLPKLSAADQANVKHLDQQAYAEMVKLRAAAQTGTPTAAEMQAAADAIEALTSAVTKGG